MARTAIAPQKVGAAGLNGVVQTDADAANGMSWPYTGRRTLWVSNGDAAAKTITVKTNAVVDGLVVPDRVFNLAAGAILAVRESDEHLQADGNVYVDVSDATSVKVWVTEPV